MESIFMRIAEDKTLTIDQKTEKYFEEAKAIAVEEYKKKGIDINICNIECSCVWTAHKISITPYVKYVFSAHETTDILKEISGLNNE